MSQKLFQIVLTENGENRLLSREMGKEQRNAGLDGKMIALVWHKLSREMDF